MGPRAKLLGLAALFALPIVASLVTYYVVRPSSAPTANYGELLLPPKLITTHTFTNAEGARFAFGDLAGQWILVAADSGECPAACQAKLTTIRQVRLALGRNAPRVARVFVVDDLHRPAAGLLEPFSGTALALTPKGLALPPGAANDRAHIYLVDPHGNVMMRWPAEADAKRMLGDLQRLLKASQIG
jgi:cytochrome oxidase Cu insertion factor (SCO1/SenC/PrrC family)